MKQIIIFLFCLAISVPAFSQEKKKENTKEKVVTVDVKKADGAKRVIKIVTDDNGKQKVIEWTDEGEMPDDIKKQLEESGIDVKILDGSEGADEKVMVKEIKVVSEGEGKSKGNVWIMDTDDGNKVIEIEMDEDGKLSEDVMKKLKENAIEIEMDEDDGPRYMMFKMKGDKYDGPTSKNQKTHRSEKKEKYKIVTTDDEGNEKVIELNGEGEMPEEMKDHMGNMEIHELEHGEGHNKTMVFSTDDMHFGEREKEYPVKAYMGAQIGENDNGVEVLEIMKDSPADKAKLQKGDVLQKINGLRTGDLDRFMTLLSYFEPNDKIEITLSRNGAERKQKLTLAERPDHYK